MSARAGGSERRQPTDSRRSLNLPTHPPTPGGSRQRWKTRIRSRPPNGCARGALGLELLFLLGSGAFLFAIAPYAEGAVSDARVLFLAALALFSVILLDGIFRTLEILDWDCPRCHENYCGGPLLFRARCNSCGHPAGTDSRRHASRER